MDKYLIRQGVEDMRGLRNFINHITRQKHNPMFILGAFIFSVIALNGIVGQSNAFASDPNNDIVRGGIWNRDLGSKCGGDVKAIMDHYWIDCNLSGVVDGRVCRDGNVYVGDRVVARNSTSIGRLPIQGSRPISIAGHTYYETHNSQALLSQCLDTWVKLDANGSFKYAIIKACGNPVWTPEPVVVNPPAPEKKNVWVCEIATKQLRYVTEEEAGKSKYSKNLADCKEKETPKEITVCRLSDKTMVTIKESEYNSTKYSKNSEDCKEVETPKKLTVCDLTTKQIVEIDEKDFKSDKHSTNQSDCKVEENPKGELPQTGLGDNLLSGGIGLGSLIVAGSAYVSSRKDWLNTLLNR